MDINNLMNSMFGDGGDDNKKSPKIFDPAILEDAMVVALENANTICDAIRVAVQNMISLIDDRDERIRKESVFNAWFEKIDKPYITRLLYYSILLEYITKQITEDIMAGNYTAGLVKEYNRLVRFQKQFYEQFHEFIDEMIQKWADYIEGKTPVPLRPSTRQLEQLALINKKYGQITSIDKPEDNVSVPQQTINIENQQIIYANFNDAIQKAKQLFEEQMNINEDLIKPKQIDENDKNNDKDNAKSKNK